MSPQLGVLIIHGIGSQPADFAEPHIREVRARLSRLGADPAQIAFQPVHWAPVLEAREAELWAALTGSHRLDVAFLRKFLISAFGDALAYNQRQPNDTYRHIHAIIHKSIRELRDGPFEGQDRPLAIIAHSLGCHIISNYIWDRQRGRPPDYYGDTKLGRMETLAGLVTFGCNLPLFTLAHEPVVAIQFPPPDLDSDLKPLARWDNYYDRDDVFAFPLKPLSPSYARSVTADHEINAGFPGLAQTAAAHTGYWTDNSFTTPVAEMLARLLERINQRETQPQLAN
jgi:hypothetical protein